MGRGDVFADRQRRTGAPLRERDVVDGAAPAHPVRFGDPSGPDGVEVTPRQFLHACRMAAQARLGGRRGGRPAFTMIGRPGDPPGPARPRVAPRTFVRILVARELALEWQQALAKRLGATAGSLRQDLAMRRLLDAVQQDLSALHPRLFVPLAPREVEACRDDVGQAIHEALARTCLAATPAYRGPRVSWEGTLVTRLLPLEALVVVTLAR